MVLTPAQSSALIEALADIQSAQREVAAMERQRNLILIALGIDPQSKITFDPQSRTLTTEPHPEVQEPQ